MLPRILPKDRLDEFLTFLMSENRLVAPVAKGPQFAFEAIETPEDIGRVRMDYDVTILPPKKVLLPAYEKLLECSGRDPRAAALV